jgi:lambda repressor-like predicted transcriptional regulator
MKTLDLILNLLKENGISISRIATATGTSPQTWRHRLANDCNNTKRKTLLELEVIRDELTRFLADFS